MDAKPQRSTLLGLVMVSVFFGAGAASQSSAATGDACRSEPIDARRLQCYDREFGRPLGAGQQPTSPVANTSEAPQAMPAVAPLKVGIGTPGMAAQDPSESVAGPSKLFSSKIRELRFTKHGAFVATLDNGQVWRQFVAEGKARIAIDDTVTIWPGWAGAYNLKTPSGWITKVHLVSAAAHD